MYPYLVTIRSLIDNSEYVHLFHATDAEDATCSAADFVTETWKAAKVMSVVRLKRKGFGQAIRQLEEACRLAVG